MDERVRAGPGPRARGGHRPGPPPAGQDRRQPSQGGQPGSFGTNGRRATAADGGPALRPGDPVVRSSARRSSSRCSGRACAGPSSTRSAPRRVHRCRSHGAVFTLIAACGGTTAGGGRPGQWVARLRDAAPNERAQAFVTAAGRRADPAPRRAGREVRRRACWPGWASSRSAGRSHAVKARLQRMNPVERAGRLQQDVRGPGGAGETQEGAARPGRGRLKRASRGCGLCSRGVTKLGPP